MKTTSIGSLGKNLLTSLTLFAGAYALSSNAAYAQDVASANPNNVTEQPAAANAQPTATLRANVYPLRNSLKFRMHYENPQGGPVTLRIRNEKGQVEYEETVRNVPKYCRDFNLSALSDGTYTFEVSCRKEQCKQSYVIQTRNDRLVVSPDSKSTETPEATPTPVIARKN